MNEQELKILISMRDEFSGKLDSIQKSLDKTSKQAEKSSESFKKLTKSVAGLVSVYGTLRFAMSTIRDHANLQEAQTRLETIVTNVTGATREQIQVLHDQARALQAVGVVDRQTIASAQAKLATFDLSIDAIKELTPALLNYAVAEFGVGVTTEQITNSANGFGKALQGNTELLTKNGFVITEYEKQVLEAGNETQRLAMFNEILGRTYKDVNEEMAKTSAGAMRQMQNQLTDLRVEIGEQLTPIMVQFVKTVSDNMPVITLLAKEFTKAIVEMVSWLSVLPGVSKATFAEIKRNLELETGLNSITAEIDVLTENMYKAKEAGDDQTKMLYANAVASKNAEARILQLQKAEKALSNEIEKSGRISKSVRKELEQAGFEIDVPKAIGVGSATKQVGLNKIAIEKVLDTIKEEIKAQEQLVESRKNVFEEISKIPIPKLSMPPIVTEDDKKRMAKEAEDLKKQMERNAKDVEKGLIDLESAYARFSENIDDELFNLSESHRVNLQNFSKQISALRSQMDSLRSGFAQQEKSDRQKIAEDIVANENRILEIQNQLKKNLHKDELRTLQDELIQRQLAQEQNATFIAGMESEIAEVKRRAGLTDLERAIEDFNARREIATQEFNEKMSSLKNEIKAVREARKQESDIYRQKVDFIREQQKLAEKQYKDSMNQNLLTTKETIQKEIEYYRQLAQAIDAVRGSNTARSLDRNIGKITNVNDAIISPNGNIISTHPDDYLIATKNPSSLGGGITVNIMGGNFLSEDVAEEIGNEIVKRLSLTQAI